MRAASNKFNTDLLLALCAMLVILFVAHVYSYNKVIDQQNKKYQTIALNLKNELGNQLANTHVFLRSLAQTTQFSHNLDSINYEELMRPSGGLQETIKFVGKFEKISIDDRSRFLESMREKGVYSFKIKSLLSNDVKLGKESSIDGDMLPITTVFPFTFETTKLIGLDLRTDTALANSFQIASSDNRSRIVGYPENMPKAGNFFMMQPHYLGRIVPEDEAERIIQASGGFIAEIDFSKTIERALNESGLKANLIITEKSKQSSEADRLVYSTQNHVHEYQGRYFTKILKGYHYTDILPVSDSRLELKLKSYDGISFTVIEKILLADFLVFLLTVPVGILIYFLLKGLRQRKDVETRLASTTAQAFKTLHAIDDTVITLDKTGLVTSTNSSADKLLGNINGLMLQDVLKMEEKDSVSRQMRAMSMSNLLRTKTKGHSLNNIHLTNSRKNKYIVDVNVNTLNDISTGDTTGHVVVIRDVSEVYKMAEEIEFRISHDSLTKLPNRYQFESVLSKSIEKMHSSGHDLALVYIDLDQFKLINDTCGHGAGDELLIKIGADLSGLISENDLLARLGGDEFGILVNNKSYDEAINFGKSIKTYFQDCYFVQDDNSFAIRASIGFVYIDDKYRNMEDVMSAADIACYTAKDRGRNDLYEYKPDGKEKNERKDELLILPKLQNALQLNGFTLYVQSIVPLDSNELNATNEYSHYEILLRMIDEEGKIFTPYQLVVAAERYDLMRDVDRWVISNAFKNIAKLNRQEYAAPEKLSIFSINISGQSAADSSLCEFIDEQLALHDVFPSQLCFELTETTAIGNMEYARAFVDFLHNRGCSVALDDFGSGVSTFGYLKNFPVDYLKIDGQFVKNILDNPVDKEMVRCMHAVAEIQGIKTIGEFVENKEIADVLKELNVGYAQGYYYNQPFPFELLFSGESFLHAA